MRGSAAAELIRQESDVLAGFVALLEEEQGLLIGGNADALPSLVERKNAQAAILARLAGDRGARLRAAGCTQDGEGMARWLAGDSAGRAAWEDLLPLAGRARELNELNGKLIADRLQRNQQALEALLPASRTQAALYGPDGQTAVPGGGRSLGSA
ncbi:MAG TPA: flagellar protein FlgN [Rhodocyclaceae bacterium]|nr:flagellar protein FlgN [Rhodocyclaceae bacterium]HNH35511.1 flagellar protein FlgN [Rhodocyclaceae bacterium]